MHLARTRYIPRVGCVAGIDRPAFFLVSVDTCYTPLLRMLNSLICYRGPATPTPWDTAYHCYMK